jgi:hypothetical protein
LVDGEPPVIELKPPGYYEALVTEEVPEHFIFSLDISPSHTTTYTTSTAGETTSMTARADGDVTHYIVAGEMGGEMIISGPDVWVRDESQQWVLDEEMFELPMFIAFPTPDYAYTVGYHVFDELAFDRWIETEEGRLAVYRGGKEAATKVVEGLGGMPPGEHDGTVEAWWAPAGYFSKVEVSVDTANGDIRFGWTISEVGTTEVEPPA